MPHTPRRYATTIGVPPELMSRPVRQHPPIPIRQAPAQAQEESRPQRLRLGLGALNLRTYEPDFGRIFETLFGKEPKIDPYTRQLVHAPTPAAAAPFGPQQAGPPHAK